jgi:hypothetical protein
VAHSRAKDDVFVAGPLEALERSQLFRFNKKSGNFGV